jgi:CubicO group peptidase (beta-lactamase class C family)
MGETMQKWIKSFVFLALAEAMIQGTLGEANAQIAQNKTETDLVREIRSELDRLTGEEKFSGAVLLAKGDQILLKEAYGFEDLAAKVSNRVTTKFYLASITKVFTAAAVLQLAQEGKFSLDDKLVKVLPDYSNKEAAGKITVRQLLTHTSGLCNCFERFVQLDFARYQTPESFLSVFANDPLEFEPGAKYSYSNAGYLVLGLIVRTASGQRYEDFVQKRIFEPADMRNSEWLTGETRGLNAAGGARSTVEDMFRFSRALQERKLLNKEYTELKLAGGAGMSAEKINGISVVGHIGGAPGMSTSFDMYPELGYTVVILSTLDGAAITVRDRVRSRFTRR